MPLRHTRPAPAHRRRGGETGSALISALLAVAVLSLLAAGTLTLASASTRSAVHWNDRLAALYAAESGLARALYELDVNRASACDRTLSGDLGSGTYEVTIPPCDVNGPAKPATVTVTATGRSGNSTRRVQAVIGIGNACPPGQGQGGGNEGGDHGKGGGNEGGGDKGQGQGQEHGKPGDQGKGNGGEGGQQKDENKGAAKGKDKACIIPGTWAEVQP